MSEATIVSVFPFSFTETKPGLIPGEFTISGAKKEDFTICHLTNSRFPVYLDSNRGSIWISVSALVLAKSIVDDYCITHLAATPDAHPGVFYLEGRPSKADILAKYSVELTAAREKQNRWFNALIKLADDDWNKFHRHDIITDIQRYAANLVGLQREWNIEVKPENVKSCPFCTTIISTVAIKCPNCQEIVDSKRYRELTTTAVSK